jgi:hypothetical protein
MPISKIQAIKTYFSTLERPVDNMEVIHLARGNKKDFDELADGAIKELGETLITE